MKNKPEVLIIHHTAVGGSSKQLHAVNRYHRDNGFPRSSIGWFVGYHYFIEKNGSITQTRTHTDVGAHTIGWNTKSIGVCLAGDFNYEQPTRAQLSTLRSLVTRLELPVDLHRNRQANRTCPGKNFTLDFLDEPQDVDDERKARLIAHYIKLYPRLATIIRRLFNK